MGSQTLAGGCFIVVVRTMGGRVRHRVIFVIRLRTRPWRSLSHQQHDAWMRPVARNLTDAQDDSLRGVSHRLRDRDPLDTAAFRRMLEESGVEAGLLPARGPDWNAFAERFV